MKSLSFNRKTISRLKLVVMIGAVMLLTAAEPLYARDDWQYWNMIQLQSDLREDLTMRIFSEQWLVDDFSEFFLANVETGFLWKPVKFFEAGPFYRYQHVRSPGGIKTRENRYTIENTLRHRAKFWEISNRNRFEYRDTSRRSFWKLRHQIRAAGHFMIRDTPVSPYISGELLYDTGVDKINEHRASAGWHTRFHQHFGLTLFYLIRSTRSTGNWKSDHALGTSFIFYI